MNWLMVLADADERAVPRLHSNSVDASNTPGAMKYPATVVVTTSPVRDSETIDVHNVTHTSLHGARCPQLYTKVACVTFSHI